MINVDAQLRKSLKNYSLEPRPTATEVRFFFLPPDECHESISNSYPFLSSVEKLSLQTNPRGREKASIVNGKLVCYIFPFKLNSIYFDFS